MNTQTSYFQDVIETIEKLPPDDQIELVEIIRHRLLEQRRAEIAQNAQQTLKAVRENNSRVGSVEDLRRDLTSTQ